MATTAAMNVTAAPSAYVCPVCGRPTVEIVAPAGKWPVHLCGHCEVVRKPWGERLVGRPAQAERRRA